MNTPITEELLLARGFERGSESGKYSNTFMLKVLDYEPQEDDHTFVLVERGNGTDLSFWNVDFARKQRLLGSDRVTLRHGIRFMEEVEKILSIWETK